MPIRSREGELGAGLAGFCIIMRHNTRRNERRIFLIARTRNSFAKRERPDRYACRVTCTRLRDRLMRLTDVSPSDGRLCVLAIGIRASTRELCFHEINPTCVREIEEGGGISKGISKVRHD